MKQLPCVDITPIRKMTEMTEIDTPVLWLTFLGASLKLTHLKVKFAATPDSSVLFIKIL